MSTNTQSERNPFNDPSLWLLLASNAATIFFALKEGWSLSNVMWVYWFQSIIIGHFQFIRIWQLKEFTTDGFMVNDRPVQPTPGMNKGIAFLFLIHYGGFHLTYFFFLLGGIFPLLERGEPQSVDTKYIALAAFLFFLNHLFSYFYNRSRDTKKQNIGQLMIYPYIRIFPMHLTIIFGAFFGGALFLFLILKTVVDCLMHIQHHYIR